jgi:hypothetical protein
MHGEAGARVTLTARYVQLLLPVLWLGMVVAISFLETPLKFRAPGVTLPIGLGIGRLVFKALNAVEIVILVTLWAACIVSLPGPAELSLLALVTIALLIQVAAIRPPLSKRTDHVLAGAVVPRSRAHWAYVVLEVVKVALLIALVAEFIAGMIGGTS